MSITSSQTIVQLKSMPLEDLRDEIASLLEEHQMSMKLESLTDDELVILVQKNHLLKTYVKFERQRHRPLDLVILADYKQSGGTKEVVRVNKPVSANNYSFKWLWIPLVFAGVIIAILNTAGDTIGRLLGSPDGLNSIQIISITVVLSTLVGVISVYGVPVLLQKREQKLQQFDREILNLFQEKINKLDNLQNNVEIRRCWSCFEELSLESETCTKCGKEQK